MQAGAGPDVVRLSIGIEDFAKIDLRVARILAAEHRPVPQVALPEIRPEGIGHPDLRVGDLPEQEVAHAQLAARPDEEVRVGLARGVQELAEPLLVELAGLGGDVAGVLRRNRHDAIHAPAHLGLEASHQRVLPGERILLAGTGPLQLAIANQIVDAGGTIRYTNRQVGALFGYTDADLVGQPIEMLVPPDVHAG